MEGLFQRPTPMLNFSFKIDLWVGKEKNAEQFESTTIKNNV